MNSTNFFAPNRQAEVHLKGLTEKKILSAPELLLPFGTVLLSHNCTVDELISDMHLRNHNVSNVIEKIATLSSRIPWSIQINPKQGQNPQHMRAYSEKEHTEWYHSAPYSTSSLRSVITHGKEINNIRS